ncbi:hypothetical protein [Streptomonospora salina]|uniref:Uncharacterized protein n=1 Tax=Streptomonospora salina TaxID=104205 RepID=A0A841ENZ6_9ACTN|nr:hypothetical protein [Streptomonospora salina]MBB6001141.1 hypothetical protein [Streptomonospora salina]
MPQPRLARPGRGREHRAHGAGERAGYWLLYVVAFPAAMLHCHAGNGMGALLCALAAAVAATCIVATRPRS